MNTGTLRTVRHRRNAAVNQMRGEDHEVTGDVGGEQPTQPKEKLITSTAPAIRPSTLGSSFMPSVLSTEGAGAARIIASVFRESRRRAAVTFRATSRPIIFLGLDNLIEPRLVDVPGLECGFLQAQVVLLR